MLGHATLRSAIVLPLLAISPVLTQGQTVTLDAAITLRRLTFNADQTGSVTLAPGTGGSLTLTSAGGGQPTLDVLALSGNHTIAANVTLIGPDAHKWLVGTGCILTVSGNIGGTQGITSQDLGTLLLNGTNTFAGATTVNLGTLGGSGSLASAVATALGTTITAGTSASASTLTLQNGLTLGGRYLVTLFDNTSASKLNVTGGTASIGAGTLEVALGPGVTVDSFRAGGPRSFTFIDAGNGQLSGTFSAANFTNAGFAANEWTVTYNNANGNVTANFTPVPEPALILVLAAGVILTGWWVRRI